MFEDCSKSLTDQILPYNLSESRKWIVVYIKEYIFNVVGLLYSLRMQCLNCYNQMSVMIILIHVPCTHCSTYKNKHCGSPEVKQ